jgi:hypothetical protein
MGYRPRRELIERAIARAQKPTGKAAKIMDTSPLTGVSIDAAFIILKRIEFLRDARGRGPGRILRGHVHEVVKAIGLPSDRGYAYEAVAMNFYGIIKEYQDELKRKRAAQKAERERKPAVA